MRRKIYGQKLVLILTLTIIITLLSGSYSYAGLISTEQEIELGEEAAAQLEAEYGLSYDEQLTSWVAKVGKKLAYIEPREGITYRFKVLNMAEPNALAIPGGFIYVTKGILRDFIKNDENMLAVVVGHELGHVNERHGMKQLEWSLGLGVLLEVLLGNDSLASDIAQMASELIFLKYSRSQETEADEYGMRVAYKAGYDPKALIRFFRMLEVYEEQEGAYSPEFLQSHPDTDSRIEDAEEYIEEELGLAVYTPDVPDDYNYYQPTPAPNDNTYYQPTPYIDYPGNDIEVNLSGTWEANFASPIILKQKGNRVTGTYQNGKGSIEGIISGDSLNYEWKDFDSNDCGTGYFNISSDGNSLAGEWYSPSGDSGKWKAWRESSYTNNNNNNNNYNSNYYDVSGVWKSTLGEITFVQKGTDVEGYFGNGKGRIKGVISGNRLDYEWYEYVDNEGGTGYFIISNNGTSMDGQWYSETGTSGLWSASR